MTRRSYSRFQSPRRRHNGGVSMLETVAALTILAIGAVVVFSWLSQTTLQLDRYAKAEVKNITQLQVLSFLRTVNPAIQPSGTQLFEGFTLAWEATSKAPLANSMSPAGTPDSYDVGLFDVTAVAKAPNGTTLVSIDATLVGYTMPRSVRGAKIFQ